MIYMTIGMNSRPSITNQQMRWVVDRMDCCTGAGDGVRPAPDGVGAGTLDTVKQLPDGGDCQVSGHQASLHSNSVRGRNRDTITGDL